MDIPLKSILELMDSNFDYLLAMDDNKQVVFLSEMLAVRCGLEAAAAPGKKLAELFEPDSVAGILRVMDRIHESKRADLLFLETAGGKHTTLNALYTDWDGGALYLFLGRQLATHDPDGTDGGLTQGAKVLRCLYSVSAWVENSSSLEKFFEKLPEYLSEGMQFPEFTVVCSRYGEKQFGDRPTGEIIRSEFMVDEELRGEVILGYNKPELELLPAEQKMLDEITRMLGWAIGRKNLIEDLANRRSQQDDLRTQLDTVNSYLEQTNQSFDESKVHLSTMFNAIPDAVAIIDKARNVVMTNRDHFEPGDKCHRTFFDSDRPCTDCRLKRIIRDKTPVNLEIEHGEISYEVHALPIFNKQNEVDGIIEIYRDVSLKKTYEQQLQQADKLSSLGQLVSGIGHEINNPNQFIRGNVKIIQQAFEDMLPIIDDYAAEHPDLKIARLKYDFFRSHIMTLIDDMANGSERIKRIVEDLKRFARKDEGQLDDTVDINTVISESARLVHNQVHKTSDIELDLGDDLPMLQGNAQKIEQVLINLIINASQAMNEDKRGLIEVITGQTESEVVIELRDNGKGMSEGTLKSIFDPFFTTKRARGGTGLGLSIVYRIIEEHRGNISAVSEVGEGTTFTIRLPKPQMSNSPGLNEE
ncbi:MAG: PAS domain-containing protein [bacterium]|nr:PAS domain-containing protein [bacterium]